jgi:hypothetical protein
MKKFVWIAALFVTDVGFARWVDCTADCKLTRRDAVDRWTTRDTPANERIDRADSCRNSGNLVVENFEGGTIYSFCVDTTTSTITVSGHSAIEVDETCRDYTIYEGTYYFPQQFAQLSNTECVDN